MLITCAHCKRKAERSTGHVNRSRKMGLRLFCSMKCFGLDRRKWKTTKQKKLEKRLYDIGYRAKNREVLRAKKKAYFKRTYDPKKAAIERKKNMARHVEYCRQPRYKEWKREYDKQYRAKEYGAFSDAYMLAINLNREIKSRMTNYEIKLQNQTLNKRQARTRSAEETPSRERHSRS